MSGTSIVLLIIILAVLGLAYIWYANLIRRRNRALEALSSIDVQLRKRHDLLPSVLKLASQFMTHERSLITELTELRAEVQKPYTPTDPDAVKKHLDAEAALHTGMNRVFAVAENYPELRSSDTIVQAQQTFTGVEGHIAAARRFYNSAVTELNNSVQIFPGSVIASLANVKVMPYFELEDSSMRDPINVDDYLNQDN